MKVIKYPSRSQWNEILERPVMNIDKLRDTVCSVLAEIKSDGDKAVKKYELMFDKVQLDSLQVSEAEIEEAEKLIDPKLREALVLAHSNISKFHEAQKFEPIKVETQPGVVCWQKSVAIEKVGLYIPGGTAPLFSTVLMLATPAKIAGCKEIVLCTPPSKDGKVNPAILCACASACAAMTFLSASLLAISVSVIWRCSSASLRAASIVALLCS